MGACFGWNRAVRGRALVVALTAQAAAAISVSTTRIEVPAGSAQTTLTLKTSDAVSADVEVRVYRWTEGQPADRLKETRDVVVSPPMSRLRGRQELTVRIVRLSKKPVRGRECHRVLVDRLPDTPERGARISLRIRHSIPLCFSG